VPESLAGFPTADIEVGGRGWLVAVADTPGARSRGLRGVDDLGDLDGMLFEWDDDSESSFTMRDTLIPLDIAFFTVDGQLVSQSSLIPCATAACPSHRAAGPYRFALETRAGGFDGMDPLTLAVPWIAVLRTR